VNVDDNSIASVASAAVPSADSTIVAVEPETVFVAMVGPAVPPATADATGVIVAVEPAGFAENAVVNVIVSSAPESAAKLKFVTTFAATPTRPDACVVVAVVVAEVNVAAAAWAADAGATEVRTPKPKAATATSAMRLKVVFVDICFLSISRSEEFPPVGFG
jgi:hypothetical protein